jgi:hypothetical protein
MHPTPVLRPMEFGDILDGAFKLYRAQFVRLFTAALIANTPTLLFDLWSAATADAMDPAAVQGVTLLRLPFVLIATVLVYGSLTHQADRALHGAPIAAPAAIAAGVRLFLPLLAAYTLTTLSILLGLVLLVVPGILLGLLFFAVTPAVVIERRGPIQALGRSRELARGALGQIAGILIVATVITLMPSFAVSAVGFVIMGVSLSAGAPPAAALFGLNAMQVLVSALAAPFSVAVMVLLYYDRRMRTEAMDVQAMAERLPTHAAV